VITRHPYINVKKARYRLSALIDEAEKGRVTIITRNGRPIAAVVPVARAADEYRQKSFAGLVGSGRGLWGKYSAKALRRLRDARERGS
jgi:prevent-host-death family protein